MDYSAAYNNLPISFFDEEKMFEVRWGRGYVTPKTLEVNESFFTEDMGYEVEDIEKINELDIDEMVYIADLSGEQIIRRIE